ncbi:MAG: HEPN domain-containing protein [Alkalibacterium gilvum]|uniref:ApeA N-terminal domain 1-containing protein n=1 Tax=Alkalibacterium gilvum TaxID=1130080 RepID=UPI003F936F51
MITLNFTGSGYFNIDTQEEKYHGNLYLNPDEGGIVLKIEIFHEGGPLGYLRLPTRINYITGELTNGFRLTLLDCVRTNMHSHVGSRDTFTYAAKFMFEGIKIPESKQNKFTQVDFVIPDVIVWGEKSSYKVGKENYSLVDNLNDNNIEIYSNSEFSVEYNVFGTMLPVVDSSLLVENITLTQRPTFIIKAEKPQEFKYFLEKYKLVKRYVEIAMKREINLVEIRSYPSKSILEENGIEYETSIKVNSSFIKAKIQNTVKLSDQISYLFMLSDMVNQGEFSRYIENADKLDPIIDLYLDIIYSNSISAVRAFLNVTQALETYHSRFKYGGNIKGFKERIDKVILEKRADSLKEEDRKFLLANSKRFVTLESRLAELLLAEFNIFFYTGKVSYRDFPHIITKTRNYYTHYDERQKKLAINEKELSPYVRILVTILEYYLLDELGFEDVEFRRKKIWETVDNIRTGFDIRDIEKNRR